MNVLRLIGLFACLTILRSANATDLAGTWKGSFDLQGTNMPVTFHLTVTGSNVTGTLEGLPTSPVEIHDGKAVGDTVRFWVNTDYEGTAYKLVFTGKASEGQIEFSFGTDDGSWGTAMTARKSEGVPVKPVAPEMASTWRGDFAFEGSRVALAFKLKESGETITGTVEGLPTTPAEVHDGKAEGDTITFWVNTDYQGQTYRLVFKGKIAVSEIKFTFVVRPLCFALGGGRVLFSCYPSTSLLLALRSDI